MAVTKKTFPQSGDKGYAEDFAALAGHENLQEYVGTGLSFTNIDYVNQTVDVTEGKAYVSQSQADGGDTDTRLELAHTVHFPTTTISFSDNTTNYVYVTPNLGTNDSPALSVYTSKTSAGATDLLIGTIDSSANVDEELNRRPDVEFDHVRAFLDLGIPVVDTITNAESGNGNIAFVTGNGSDTKGIWFNDGAEWEYSGITSLRDSDVSGVEALIADTNANRPTAGTAGRLFFETDTHSVFFDTGSAWISLGVDPANIGANDLGFNPATQSELDSHTATGNAHHAKTTTLDELTDSDASAIIVDTESNLPVAGTADRVFLARDTGKILYDNGANWVLIGASKHNQIGGQSSDDHHIRPIAGVNITEDSGQNFNVDQGAGSNLDADLLDGVQLAAIDWPDVTMDQTDVNVSHLGAADAALDMNGNDVTGVASLTLGDADADTTAFKLAENATSGDLELLHGTAIRLEFTQTGDMSIEGTYSEGVAL